MRRAGLAFRCFTASHTSVRRGETHNSLIRRYIRPLFHLFHLVCAHARSTPNWAGQSIHAFHPARSLFHLFHAGAQKRFSGLLAVPRAG
jgi:hypothetical protein